MLSSPVYAANAAGGTGAAFLEIAPGARANAMGEANVAWADDVYGLYFNPAGAARVSRKEVGFVYNSSFSDLNYNYFGYLHPLREFGGTLGVNLTYLDLGTVRRTTIASAATSTYLDEFTSHDLAAGITYARPFRSFLDLGVSLKIIQEKLDRYTATGVAADLGAIWHPPVTGLTIGLSLANLGSSLRFIREKDELPLTMRAGAGFRSSDRRWGVAGDLVMVKAQDIEGKFGGEYWVLRDRLGLRAGFNTANDLDNGFTVGAAFKWDDLSVDYAYTPYGNLGDAHSVSLTCQFGAARVLPGGRVTGMEDELSSRRAAPAPATPVERPTVVERPAPAPVTPLPPVTYGQPEPPVSALAGSPLPALVCALPFVYQSGPDDYDWIMSGLPLLLHNQWRRAGVVATHPRSARYVVRGEYWVIDGQLIVAATLMDEGWEAAKFQARGDVNDMDAFDSIARQLAEELARRGLPIGR